MEGKKRGGGGKRKRVYNSGMTRVEDRRRKWKGREWEVSKWRKQ